MTDFMAEAVLPPETFRVTTNPDEVTAFAEAISPSKDATANRPVPMTFPMHWMSRPEIKSYVMSRVFSKGVTPSVLPVHIEQKIALSRPLKLACDYHLRVTVDPAPGRKTFRVTGRILTLDSEEIGSLLTTIALVEIPARAGK